jgi:tellurite resistance protein
MGLKIPPVELAPYGLRAMKTVAMADGRFEELERRMMAAAQQALGTDLDIDVLEPITPEELASAITDAGLRNQIAHGLVILSMADEEPSKAESALVSRFARALGVEGDIANLEKLAAGQSMLVRFDLARRVWVRDKVAAKLREEGLGWLVRAAAALAGIREDTKVAARYRALAKLPPGTLGRSYFEFIRKNQFALPGEKGSPPEPIVFHDMTHVLTGYDTTPRGEMQIAFFHAGSKRVDPFFFAFFALMQFHLGFRATPVAQGERGQFVPEETIVALKRGIESTIDPLDGWDPWQTIDTSVEELRDRYHIGPPPPWA